jgi:hypothetical protein
VSDLLTAAELRAMDITVDLVNVMCQEVIGHGPTRQHDVGEFVAHVHCIQQAILSQAAGRAYPDRFRTLGETLRAVEPVERDGTIRPESGAPPHIS